MVAPSPRPASCSVRGCIHPALKGNAYCKTHKAQYMREQRDAERKRAEALNNSARLLVPRGWKIEIDGIAIERDEARKVLVIRRKNA